MNAKEKFLDHLLKGKTKGTYKSYKRGLELFLEWYGKDANSVLVERKADIASEDFQRRKNFDYQVEYFYEERHIEFKGSTPWREKRFKAKITKSILALANIKDGGHIVIGKEEREDGTHEPIGMSDNDNNYNTVN